MSSFEFLKNNVIEEVLREKGSYYLSKKKKNDFWIVECPRFIYDKKIYLYFQETTFYTKTNQKYFAILSSDKIFIDWLSLRMGYFQNISTLSSFDISQITDKNNFSKFTKNGLFGISKIKEMNPLVSLAI